MKNLKQKLMNVGRGVALGTALLGLAGINHTENVLNYALIPVVYDKTSAAEIPCSENPFYLAPLRGREFDELDKGYQLAGFEQFSIPENNSKEVHLPIRVFDPKAGIYFFSPCILMPKTERGSA
ncbi:MAG: hypothetical protein AABX28_01795 [Nanoarchaeota archaeon]